MITNSNFENFRDLKKIAILNSKNVFYPFSSVLQKKDIIFNDADALIIFPLPEDVKFPSSSKNTDSGMLFNYKVDITVTDQKEHTEEQIVKFMNKKVIIVFFYENGKVIIGCNENPLQFLFNDDNSSVPTSDQGFSITVAGSTYFLKVNR